MTRDEFGKWFYTPGIKSVEIIDEQNHVYMITVGDFKFKTKPTKNPFYVSLCDVTNGTSCIRRRIGCNIIDVWDAIYTYLYKQMGVTNG